MKRTFTKRPGCLVPAHQEDEIWLSRIKTGDLVVLESKRPRNQGLHRKWWALANYLAENSSQFPTAEHASKWLLIRLGFCTWIESRKGSVPIADSISFAKMDEPTFQKVYDRACDLLCEMLPNVTDETVKRTLAEFAGIGAAI